MANDKPPYVKYALLLRKVVTSTWLSASVGARSAFVSAVTDWDKQAAQKAAKEIIALGEGFSESTAKKRGQICTSILTSSTKYWSAHAEGEREKAGITKVAKSAKGTLSSTGRIAQHKIDDVDLAALADRQIGLFLSKFPDRILNPALEEQIAMMANNPSARNVDIGRITERLSKVVDGTDYLDNLSHVQVARFWQANGILMAQAEGVERVQIVEMIGDKRTCPVCVVAHGQEIEVGRAAKKCIDELKIEDPEEYVAAWPFPRFPEVHLWSPEDWTKDGRFPPFHPRCRGHVRYLY